MYTNYLVIEKNDLYYFGNAKQKLWTHWEVEEGMTICSGSKTGLKH